MNRKSRHGQSFRKKVEKNKRERARRVDEEKIRKSKEGMR